MITQEQLRLLVSRDNIGSFLNEHGLTGTGVEVGTFEGKFAESVLDQWKGKLVCIDPWVNPSWEEYPDGCNRGIDLELCYHETKRRLERFGDRVEIRREASPQAASRFKDQSLDWCFIDGNHDGPAVRADLEAWWPKMKSGALFSGHDLYTRLDDQARCRVMDAVLDFVSEHKLPRFHNTWCTSFWIIKQ